MQTIIIIVLVAAVLILIALLLLTLAILGQFSTRYAESLSTEPDKVEPSEMTQLAEMVNQNPTSSWGRNSICPFHDGTTPNMMLNFGTGIFHCFECGKHGQISDLKLLLKEEIN